MVETGNYEDHTNCQFTVLQKIQRR